MYFFHHDFLHFQKQTVEVFINMLPLANANAELQITDKDLKTYGLIEGGDKKEKAVQDGSFRVENCLAPPVGLEPTTLRLTAACSTD